MSLILILGNMFSGKSSEMFRRVERYKYAGKKCVILRPERDNRKFLTRSNLEKTSDISIQYVETLKTFDEKYFNTPEFPDILGIDETEFFDDTDYLIKWANAGYEIIACALNGDRNQQPWPSIQKLIPNVDDIYFTKAVCISCGKDASFTYADFKTKEQIVVGDKQYFPLCRECLLKRKV
jgi:thymidine kinase